MEVPVKELQPFEDPPYPPDVVGIPVSRVELEFQWTPEPDVRVLREADTEEDFFIALGPPRYRSEVLELGKEVEVLRRPGPYYRF